jgi:hypothetical protein
MRAFAILAFVSTPVLADISPPLPENRFVVVPPAAEVRAFLDGPRLEGSGHAERMSGYFVARVIGKHRDGWLEVETASPVGSCYRSDAAVRLFVRAHELAAVLAHRHKVTTTDGRVVRLAAGVVVLPTQNPQQWRFVADDLQIARSTRPPSVVYEYAPQPAPWPSRFEGRRAGEYRDADEVAEVDGHYALMRSVGGRKLTLSVDAAWVADPSRALDEAVRRHREAASVSGPLHVEVVSPQ